MHSDLQKFMGNQETLRMLGGSQSAKKGLAIPPSLRSFLESRFGENLDGVRIHSGGEASRATSCANSSAFALGEDIFFGPGQYAPQTPEGVQLLSHELTHVLQQRRGSRSTRAAETEPGEAEATKAAAAVTAGSNVTVRGSARKGIARQKEPHPPTPKVQLYKYTFEGKEVTLTEEEYKREVARTIHNLEVEFRRVEGYAEGHRETHRDFLEHTHNIFGVISDIVADTAPPQLGIWNWPRPAINNGREALKNGKVEVAARQLKLAQNAFKDAQKEWNSYIEKTISGAETTKSALETTRDISFAIAIGTAAIVAAPVVAGGLAAAGVTGVAGTAATGVVITAGGGVVGAGLRTGSAAAGQGLAFGHVKAADLKKEAKEGFKHGAIDAGTAFLTAGTAKFLGEGTSVAGRVVRHAAAGGVGGGFSGGAEALAEGKSLKEAAKATGIGVVSGLVGGGVTSAIGGGSSQQSALRRIVAGGTGSVAAGTTAAVLSGGSLEDVKRGIGTNLVTGLATSAATPSHGGPTGEGAPTPKRTAAAPEHVAEPATKPRVPAAGPVSLEEFRQKKAASTPRAVAEESAPAPEKKATIHSLEEARQKKAAAAKKTPPTSEAESQPILDQQPEVEQEPLKLAAGAEGQVPQAVEHEGSGTRRLKVVASKAGGSNERPRSLETARRSTGPASTEDRPAPRKAARRTVRAVPEHVLQHLEQLRERFPELKNAGLKAKVRHPGPGMFEERMRTGGGDHSFEARLKDGRVVQLDDLRPDGTVHEVKTRFPGEGRTIPEVGQPGAEIPPQALRDFEIQMEKQSDFIKENGLPNGVWETNDPALLEVMVEVRNRLGIRNISLDIKK